MSARAFRTCAAALAIALSVPIAARAFSTMEMMEKCKALANAQILPESKAWIADTSFESGTCYGAFVALHELSYDKVYFVGDAGRRDTMLSGVCPPDGIGVVQMVRIFDAHARQHPEESAHRLRVDSACSVKAGLAVQVICAPISRGA